ncbi:MAG: hypothetical protein MJ233_00230 [Mycoplasmoidaceae bacterium]|nr:hypothetical protein [Mycoplasmoidaceae bacterium]
MKKKIPFGIVIGLSTALMSVSTFSCAKYESCSYVGLYEEYEPNYTPYTESTIIAQKTLDAYMSNENRKQMICQDLLNTINFIYRPYEAEVTNYEYFVQLNDLVEKTTATSTVYVLSYYMSIRASVNHQKLFEIQVKNLPY